MARYQPKGNTRAFWVTTISNTSAPTVAEINAGFELTGYLRGDGITTPQSGSTIDVSSMDSRFNKTAPGTFGGDPNSLKLYRDSVSGTDLAYTTLARDTAGYLVIREGVPFSTAIAASQRFHVTQGTIISREMQPTADNEPRHFVCQMSVEAVPVDNAVSV